MPLRSYQEKMINLMVQQELALAEIYLFLSNRFPDRADFWKSMHDEELKHAQWVEYFGKKVAAGEALFDENKTRTYTVQAYLDYLKSTMQKIKTTTLSFKEALSLSIDIEGALLERKVFQYFAGDSPEIRSILKKLSEETAGHLKQVKDLRQQIPE